MFLCETHLNIIAMSEMKYDCTSCTAKDFYFISVDKRFCTGCMRNFDKSLPFYFLFVEFRLIEFCVNSSSSV